MKTTKRHPPPTKGKRKLDTRINTKPTKILSKPCYRAARKFAAITTLGKRQPLATTTPQTETSSSVTAGKKEIPNVTDFLTFLCYRRTHALPAKLNFNKLFDSGTGEHQVRQKQELPHKKTAEKDKTLSSSWMGMDNNNKGDAFNMRDVLRKLFLGDDIIDETKDKKKPGKPKSVKNPPKKPLKNVQNGKSSKKCLKEETRRRKPATAVQRKKSTKAITSRKTEKLTKTAKTKSFNVPKSKQQQQQSKQQQKEARKTKKSSIVTRSNKKKKIKFIRN